MRKHVVIAMLVLALAMPASKVYAFESADEKIRTETEIDVDVDADEQIETEVEIVADEASDGVEGSDIPGIIEGSDSESDLFYGQRREIPADYTGVTLGPDGRQYLYRNGVVDTSYNGLYTVYLIKNGAVWRDYNDFYEADDHTLIKIRNGRADSYYCDIFNSPTYGFWLVRYGRIDYSYTGTYHSSAADTSVEVVEGRVIAQSNEFPLVTDFRWEAPGKIVFVQPAAYKIEVDTDGYERREQFRYAVQVVNPDGDTLIYKSLWNKNDGTEITVSCNSFFVKSGTYKFRVKTSRNKYEESFDYGVVTDWKTINYQRPGNSYAVPLNIRIVDTDEGCMAKWDAVPGCKYYCLRGYCVDNFWDYIDGITDTSYRMSYGKAEDYDPFEWRIQVWAYGDDPSQTAAGFAERVYPEGLVPEADEGGSTIKPDDHDNIKSYQFEMKYGQSEARSMLTYMNDFRTGSDAWAWDYDNTDKTYYNNGKLVYDYGLEQDAMQRAAEIAISFDHTRPNGLDCFSAYTNSSGRHGENIAVGYTNAEDVFCVWREDKKDYNGQEHRRNMLGDFIYVGIGHVYFNGTHYWVQEFSTVKTNLSETPANDSDTDVTVEISDANITNGSYRLEGNHLRLNKGESTELPKLYKTVNVPNGEVPLSKVTPNWTSSDPDIAVISGNSVKAHAVGRAWLTVSYDNWFDSIYVDVKDVSGFTGLAPASDGTWYLYNNDSINYYYNGLYCDANVGWWLVLNGKVAFDYNDLYCDGTYGWWKINGGAVDFGYTDLYGSPTYGWWKIYGGAVDFGYTDLYGSPQYGWWKVNGGSVDFGYSDLYGSPTCGWWKIKGGAVDFGYTDLFGSPTYGWWLVSGGAVNFGYTDLYGSPSVGWWLVSGGSIDFGYFDIFRSPVSGNWKVSGGRVEFEYNGVYNSQRYGRCYVSGGAAQF